MTAQTKKLPTFKKLILDELKNDGLNSIVKKIKSIRYSTFSMGSAVDVHAINLTRNEREKLESVISKYKSGSYNSMEDIYEFRKNADVVRTAKYVCLVNDFDSDIKEKIKNKLNDEFGVFDSVTSWKVFNKDYQQILYRELNNLEEI